MVQNSPFPLPEDPSTKLIHKHIEAYTMDMIDHAPLKWLAFSFMQIITSPLLPTSKLNALGLPIRKFKESPSQQTCFISLNQTSPK